MVRAARVSGWCGDAIRGGVKEQDRNEHLTRANVTRRVQSFVNFVSFGMCCRGQLVSNSAGEARGCASGQHESP